MHIIIPLGGLGTRFKKFGYSLPKPLVNVFGKPIIFWLLDNLNLTNIDKVLIPYNKELKKYNFEETLRNKYPKTKFKFLELENDTRGATETVLLMLNLLEGEQDCPILSLDGDNFYNCDIITQWAGENKIFTFEDYNQEPIYSYIKFINNHVTDIVEKNKISDYACCGSYGFNSWITLKKYCKYIIDNNILQKGEFYISNIIKQMIQENIKFTYGNIPKEHYICLGTPLHVKIFCNNYPKFSFINKKSLIENKRICFDFDNTLVSYPEVSGDYKTVKPIEHNINFLRFLKSLGNTIIIYTARRMKTHGGNTGKLLKDIGKITFDTLDKFNIPYDEIYFGKPEADFYIDDKAVNCFNELDKELGYYNSIIEPRDFNNISSSNTIEVLKKTSDNLEGQIKYYLNLPNEIKDIFPFFFSYDNIHFKWYEMEKINGIPISKLFIKGELTNEIFDIILNNIHKIHKFKITDENNSININIYENYSNKLVKRYEEYNYKKFKNSELVYKLLLEKLTEYENKKMGKLSLIHGDPVFTNIIITNNGKIKFIDMRGQIGKQITNMGDLFYDYAKIYQSLLGYDEILNEEFLSEEYKNKLLVQFKNIFINNFGEEYWEYLQYLTASLLFTLIPLHDNEKCIKYYKLIFKIIS